MNEPPEDEQASNQPAPNEANARAGDEFEETREVKRDRTSPRGVTADRTTLKLGSPGASGTDPEKAKTPRSEARPQRTSAKDERPFFVEDETDAPRSEGRALWQKILIWTGIGTVVALIAGIVTVVSVVQHFSKDLPDVRELEKGYAPPQVTRVLARDGTLLANLFLERRTVVPIEKIPDHVKTAFLAAEDAGFFEHEGLDYLGLVRAMVVNLRSGRVKQGGSTITQQVVKNVLLDHERSYRRKIRETILAYRLEKTLTKEQILGMYMNHLYLGHGRYGVEEAGRYYFGKHVGELDVAEAALLSGIVAAPERYSPRKDETKALARRTYVLGQMLDKGFMTREVYEASLEEPLRLAPAVESESDIAPEMVGHTQRLLQDLVGDKARAGGFTVKTTIDPALQIAARKAVREGLDDYLKRQKLAPPFTLETRRLWGKLFEGTPRQHGIYTGTVVGRDDDAGTITVQVGAVRGEVDLNSEERFNPTHLSPTEFVGEKAALRVRLMDDPTAATDDAPVRLRLELGPQAALVALDPKTREVLAAVGSYEAQAGSLDRSIQTKRQPGSTFKPIVYSYALNTHQVTAATTFRLKPTDKERESLREAAREDSEEGETGRAPAEILMTLREGVAQSDNRVARRVFRMVGGQQAVGWARALGIKSKLGPDESLMLGSYEMTVTEMAGAFSVFASGGTYLEPHFVTSIESGAGPVPLKTWAPERRVIDPEVAFLTTSILQSVIEEGTGKRAATLRRPLAGKTGTTNKAKDAWFIGYSTDLVVAVWVGYDDALPLGWGESGATSALPIWMSFMKSAHEGKPATQFPRPAGIVEAEIDPRTGLLARYGQEDAVTEIFLPGTAPTETASEPEAVDSESLEEPEHSDVADPDGAGPDAIAGPDAASSRREGAPPDDGDAPPPPPPPATDEPDEDEPPPF